MTHNLSKGWNMISSFGYNNSLLEIFNEISNNLVNNTLYSYNNGYQQIDFNSNISQGIGYWIKLSESVNFTPSGTSDSFTITYNKGWNMIATPFDTSFNLNNSELSNNIVENTLYEYNNGYSQITDNVLLPGKGYWIKLKELITITFNKPGLNSDFIIVGGGPGGILSAYKISQDNPNVKILLLEKNDNTLEDYKELGYDNTSNWQTAMNDSKFQSIYLSNDDKTVWLGKGLGGGTLHFGLQYIDNIDKNYENWTTEGYFNELASITQAKQYDYTNNNSSPGWTNIKNILDNSASEIGLNVYNNKVYSTDLNNKSRLLLGDLINSNPNITIKYNTKINNIVFDNSNVSHIKDMDNNYYYTDNLILSTGAIETPGILQRSNIDCGNKIYDHFAVNFVYGKIEAKTITTTTTTTQPNQDAPNFVLNTTNIGKINSNNIGKIIRIASGTQNGDDNKVYDFTAWASEHGGGPDVISNHSGNYVLSMPSWHSSSRWTGTAANFRIYIGMKDTTINYNNLPSNLKSQALYDSLFPDEEITETTTEISYVAVNDLSLNQNEIVNHLQTRDNSLTWQTYYSGIPDQSNIIVITYATSTDLNNNGFVKLNNNDLDISLNHLGGNYKNTLINYLLNAINKNESILNANGYQRFQPASNVDINSSYIELYGNSIYHYHGTCAIGDVVDENLKVYNYNNLYIADNSVLDKPWGGSTSVPAAITGLIVSKNFINYQTKFYKI